MTLGFFLEAALGHFWSDTIFEPFAPIIALVALLTGYFVVSRGESRHAAAWTWIVGTAWLAFGIYDAAWGSDAWDPKWSPEKTRFAYVIADLFTTKCRDNECFGELIFTMPFTASVMYSVGAFIKLFRQTKA